MQPLFASFGGADSLLNKIEGASIGAAPPPPATVSAVVEKVAYDTSTSIEPARNVVEKVSEAAPAASATVSLPSVEMPSIEMPSIEMPSIGGFDLPLPVIGGIAVAVLVAVAVGASGGGDAVSSSSGGSSSSMGSVDVSIPYDAAAMLAYEEAGNPGDFESFKKKYLADTVAMVKSKQKVKV